MNDHSQNEVQKAIAGELQRTLPDTPIYTGMNENERDTHFLGFAERLWAEINEKGKFNIDMEAPDTDEIVTTLIAQFAYDLVYHTMEHMTQGMAAENEHHPAIAENVLHIPDLDSL